MKIKNSVGPEEIQDIKTQILDSTSNSIILRLKKEGMNIQEFASEVARVGEFFLKKLYKMASKVRGSRGSTKTISDLKREAVVLAISSVVNAVYLKERAMHKGPEQIRSLEEAERVIRSGSGLDTLEDWIKKQGGKGVKIVKASGKEWLINALLRLYVTGETVLLYESPVKLRKQVHQLLAWLRIVSALEKQSEKTSYLLNLTYNIGKEMNTTWSQEKTILSLIVALTLNTDRALFSLEQLQKFCEMVKDPLWKGTISASLDGMFMEDEGDIRFSENEIVNQTIETLLKKANQSVFFFQKKVPFFSSLEEDLLKKGEQVMVSAVDFAVRGLASADSPWRKKDIEKQVQSTVGGVTAKNAYRFIINHPYFIPWLAYEQIFRISFVQGVDDDSLQKASVRYAKKDQFEAVKEFANKTLTVAEVFQRLLKGEDFFGIKFDFFTKNISLQNNRKEKLSIEQERRMFNTILSKIVSSLAPSQLSEWLLLIEKNNEQFNARAIPATRIAAAYVSVEKSKRPNIISDLFFQYQWSKYITEEAILFFLEKSTTSLSGLDIFKNKKFTLYI